MKTNYKYMPLMLTVLMVTFFLHFSSAQNVGIGTATPTEKLDVLGNLKFTGALMPNNNAGTTGRVLLSAGAGVAPTWGPAMVNTPATTSWGKMYSALSWTGGWPTNTFITFIITDPNLTNASAVAMSFDGPFAAAHAGLQVRSIVTEAGQMRITVVNSSGATLTGSIAVAFILFY